MAPPSSSAPLRPAPLTEEDLDEVLALNEHWVPHVGSLERGALSALVDSAELAVGLKNVAALAGFVIVLGAGADYSSPNYRFFADRHETFTYVDRVAVAPVAQGRGVGRQLYELVVAHAGSRGSPVVCAEVNLQPPNPESLAFHRSIGFVGVGTQWTYGHTVQVQMLERRLDTVEGLRGR